MEILGDFCVFFGAKYKVKEQMISGSMPANSLDIRKSQRNIPHKSSKNNVVLKNDETIGKCHFRIRYCPFSNKYMIKDMGDGSGTFIRIEEPTILKSGTVICVGESHIIVGLIFDSMGENTE